MTRIPCYIVCSVTLLICAPTFSQPTQMMLSLNEAKHYQAKPTGQVYIRADKFQRKSNAEYYRLIVQSAVKSPVHVIHQQGHYSVTVGPLASASSIRNVADKLKYDPGLTATKHPTKAASAFVAKQAKKTNHNQFALYDRSTLTDPTTEESTTTPNTEQTTHSDQITNTDQNTNTDLSTSTDQSTTDSTTNTEQATQPEQSTEQNHTSEQSEQIISDEQPKETEKTSSNKKTKQYEKHAKQAKSKTVVKSESKSKLVAVTKSEPFKDTVVTKQSRLQALMNIFPKGDWIVSAGVGVSDPSFGSSMSINNNSGAPAPYNLDTYTTKSRTQQIAGLSVGYRWMRDNQWLSAFSLNASYQHLFSRNVGSQVIQYSDPEFTNYNYDWQVSSDILMALLKANIFEYKGVSPYLLGGMGVAFNRASNYSEGSLSGVTARTNPAFGANTMTNYAYRIGAGLEYQIDQQVLVSMEYQFQSIGNITSDYGTQAWSGQYLNLGSYQSNSLLLTVTYIFGATD